jgi:hypothetical protein
MGIAERSHYLSQTPAPLQQPRAVGETVIVAGIAVAALVLAIQCCRYLLLGTYFDHIEGNVVISGWQYAHGDPLYDIEDGAPRFATYYGPLAYLAPLPALLLLGANVTISKLTSIVALLGTVALMGYYFLRHPTGGEWRQGVFFLVGALLVFTPVSFWARPDPIETLVVGAAIISTSSPRRPVWVGICLGVAVNLKAHAGFYFLPILADLWWTSGSRALAVAVVAAIASFIAPFLAPGISLHDYLAGLAQQIGARPQSSLRLSSIVITAVLLLLPVMVPLVVQRQPRRTQIYATATVMTLALLFYPATFPGAGAYHFLPLLPVLADLRYRLRPQGIDAALSPFVILFFGLLAAGQTLHLLTAKQGEEVPGAEALALARESVAGPVQVGYGDNLKSYERSQLSKTVLALNSYPALVDAQILMELRQIGIEGSARWISYLTECRIGRWLLPKRETPFATRSYFYDDAPLFGEGFRSAFFANYRLVKSTVSFGVWECTGGGATANSRRG